MDRIRALSEYLTHCRSNGARIVIAPHERPVSLDDGYRVQRQRHDDLGQGGLAGYKIGCTTHVMQQFLSIDQPCAGSIRLEDVHASGVRLASANFVRAAVECEIAVRMRETPDDLSPASLARAVGTVMPAIELVDDRYDDYSTLGAATLIADDFFHTGLVLGSETPFDPVMDLDGIRGALRVNGEIKGTGRGSDILGSPLNALGWLARHLAGMGLGLQPNMVVSLGSVVETWWASAGENVRVTFDQLGDVSCSFA